MIRIDLAILAADYSMLFGIKKSCRAAATFFAFGTCALAPMAAIADVVVIRDDRGGPLIERTETINNFRVRGTRVQLRGRYCLSACTLYLGLKNTCISPNTLFGFHGPSSPMYGIALPRPSFEYWSGYMAKHYPEPLKSWFLESGRYRIVGFHTVSGERLIEMGISECPHAPEFTTG